MGSGMGWGGGLWWIFPMLMVIFMIALCVFMARMQWHSHGHRDHGSPALQVLGERFARGEITKEEFEEKRAILVRRV
jgi:putative membrane protein